MYVAGRTMVASKQAGVSQSFNKKDQINTNGKHIAYCMVYRSNEQQ